VRRVNCDFNNIHELVNFLVYFLAVTGALNTFVFVVFFTTGYSVDFPNAELKIGFSCVTVRFFSEFMT